VQRDQRHRQRAAVLLPAAKPGTTTYTIIINRTNTSAESVTWYLNGNQFFQVNQSQVPVATWQAAIDHSFSIIFDLAMGGGYPQRRLRLHHTD